MRNPNPWCVAMWHFLSYLRVSLEVSLEKRLLVPRLRVCDRGVASWESVGEAGGPLYVAVRRSLSWPPWKVLRPAVPRGKRRRSGVVVLAMLWMDATGFLGVLGDTATLLSWTKKGKCKIPSKIWTQSRWWFFHCRCVRYCYFYLQICLVNLCLSHIFIIKRHSFCLASNYNGRTWHITSWL